MATSALGSAMLAQEISPPFLVALTLERPGPSGRRRDRPLLKTVAGTLIAPRWVLTAAHVADFRYARVGASGLWNSSGEVVAVERAFRHLDYDDRSHAHDIALLRLRRPVTNSEPVRLACDAGWRAQEGRLEALGWGRLDGRGYAGNLRRRSVEVCDRALGVARYATSRMPLTTRDFCVVARGEAATAGDSGGPILLEALDGGLTQVGITSLSFQQAGLPERVIEVASYRPWIRAVLAGLEEDITRAA